MEFRKLLKSKIVKVIKLEITSLQVSLVINFAITTHLILRCYILSKRTEKQITHNVLEHIIADTPLLLLKHSSMSKDEFDRGYEKQYALEQFRIWTSHTPTDKDQIIVKPIKNLLLNLLSCSFDTYSSIYSSIHLIPTRRPKNNITSASNLAD